jgi:3D-(3,5/4)-trihydroxycyclohexane-1,2-dione acylhydrolase (decyclizing)
LKSLLQRAIRAQKTSVVVIDTDPRRGTAQGGAWWMSRSPMFQEAILSKKARKAYEQARKKQALGA